jgi:O-acetyl-ADP-ribose deacetylase (regulator of RNase III)
MKITYLKGDATNPQGDSKKKIIVHICNDIGAWGAGFVLAVSKRWDDPEESYRNMPEELRTLGNVMFVPVENDIIVANMIAQHDVRPDKYGKPPIRFQALQDCLLKVNEYAKNINATVHMPRIGCGLAGGKWELVEKVINKTLQVDVYVYDLQ